MHRVGVSKKFRILLLSILLIFTFRNNKMSCHPGLELAGLAISVAAHVGAILGLSYLSEHNARPVQTIKRSPEKSKPNCTVIYDLQSSPPQKKYSAPIQKTSPKVKSKFENITPPPFFQDCINPDSSPYKNLYGDCPAPYGSDHSLSWDINWNTKYGKAHVDESSWLAAFQAAYDWIFGYSKNNDQNKPKPLPEEVIAYNKYKSQVEDALRMNSEYLYGKKHRNIPNDLLACAPHSFHGFSYSARKSSQIIKSFCEYSKDFLENKNLDWSSSAKSFLSLQHLDRELSDNRKLRRKKIKHLERTFGSGYIDNHFEQFYYQATNRINLNFGNQKTAERCRNRIKTIVGEKYFKDNEEWFIDRILEDREFRKKFIAATNNKTNPVNKSHKNLYKNENILTNSDIEDLFSKIQNFENNFSIDENSDKQLVYEAKQYKELISNQAKTLTDFIKRLADKKQNTSTELLSKYVYEMLKISKQAQSVFKLEDPDKNTINMNEVFRSIKNMNEYMSKALMSSIAQSKDFYKNREELFLVKNKFLGQTGNGQNDTSFILRLIASGLKIKNSDNLIDQIAIHTKANNKLLEKIQNKSDGLIKKNSLICNVLNPLCSSCTTALSLVESSIEKADVFENFNKNLEQENNYIEKLRQDFKEKELKRKLEIKESLSLKEEWFSKQSSDKKISSKTSKKTNSQEYFKNTKEEVLDYLSIDHKNNFLHKRKIANFALKQLKLCENELKTSSKNYLLVCKKRLDSALSTLRNSGKETCKKYDVSDKLLTKTDSWGMTLDKLGELSNNNLQHNINEEAIKILNQAVEINDAFFDVDNIVDMVDLVGNSACGAYEFGQNHEYDNGYRLLDFASCVYNISKKTGTFLYLSGKGSVKGCWRAGTFPFILAKNLATAPIETLSGIATGIGRLASCLVRAMWETTTFTKEEFAQSKTANTIRSIYAKLDSMSYEEKVEEGAALLTELFFPVALSKIKFFERSKKFSNSLRKILKSEKNIAKTLKSKGATKLSQKAGAPVLVATEEAIKESFFAEALARLNTNDIHHILQKKHDWYKVVSDPKDWNRVSKVVNKVLIEGVEDIYNDSCNVFIKSLNISEEIVEVTYRKSDTKFVLISNAWVKNI